MFTQTFRFLLHKRAPVRAGCKWTLKSPPSVTSTATHVKRGSQLYSRCPQQTSHLQAGNKINISHYKSDGEICMKLVEKTLVIYWVMENLNIHYRFGCKNPSNNQAKSYKMKKGMRTISLHDKTCTKTINVVHAYSPSNPCTHLSSILCVVALLALSPTNRIADLSWLFGVYSLWSWPPVFLNVLYLHLLSLYYVTVHYCPFP